MQSYIIVSGHYDYEISSQILRRLSLSPFPCHGCYVHLVELHTYIIFINTRHSIRQQKKWRLEWVYVKVIFVASRTKAFHLDK